MAQPFHRLGKNCNKAKALGMKKFEMALVVGTDPVLAYTCQVQNVPDTTDDWSLAGLSGTTGRTGKMQDY